MVGEQDLVALDSTVAKLAVVLSHEPRDGPLDHRPLLAASLAEVGASSEHACGGEEVVVRVEHDRPAASLGLGAAPPERAGGAVLGESGAPALVDRDGDSPGAGDRASGFVDLEVIEGVATPAGAVQRHRFDGRCHLVLLEVLTQFAGAVGGVTEHLGAGWLAVEKARCRNGIAGVAGRELGGRDDAGLGLGGEMCLVAVPVGVLGLVGVAGLCVDDRDDAVRCSPLRDLPASGSIPRLDVLAGDKGEARRHRTVPL